MSTHLSVDEDSGHILKTALINGSSHQTCHDCGYEVHIETGVASCGQDRITMITNAYAISPSGQRIDLGRTHAELDRNLAELKHSKF
ncbi:MAG: hypothetical protein UU54_C0015G0003 [Candidatus Yanofskybacteria bacterium GW2011_GWA2_41_22]|uniref:Uncharacterized protein n=3 Tax=Parcubacteria group TaxID=1794811 RepID=A0A1F8HTJ8_9BACT|nr:MAG: hypothetical protein UU54_C0015G0003 [Candidatus Yanofskybacteria bacterium GW2011_GWA2_41_22]KKS24965.1 MAG: hypothetical protein UU83_C0014G0013 [Candidatus Jorgensenbacteria bacterium GW2011_GWF2_41_8]OGN40469.1 MAG: hypothetical protein A2606_01755 [Candidatus Yanofskybacteria bacterium RIFOXYD1_FULL_42_10]